MHNAVSCGSAHRRLVAQADEPLGVSDFAYWLTGSNETPRDEVRVFADWIVQEAQLTAASLSGIATPTARSERSGTKFTVDDAPGAHKKRR